MQLQKHHLIILQRQQQLAHLAMLLHLLLQAGPPGATCSATNSNSPKRSGLPIAAPPFLPAAPMAGRVIYLWQGRPEGPVQKSVLGPAGSGEIPLNFTTCQTKLNKSRKRGTSAYSGQLRWYLISKVPQNKVRKRELRPLKRILQQNKHQIKQPSVCVCVCAF